MCLGGQSISPEPRSKPAVRCRTGNTGTHVKILDLSDNTILACTGRGIAIQDPRNDFSLHDARYIYRATEDRQGKRLFQATLVVYRAGRLLPDGTRVEVACTALDYPHRAYAKKVLQGVATYEDGFEEDWRIQVDPVHMRFHWVRQPHGPACPLYFRLVAPRQSTSLELWHSGSGKQVPNEAVPGIPTSAFAQFEDQPETELLFYTVYPKSCLRLELPVGGHLSIRKCSRLATLLDGEPGWSLHGREEIEDSMWEAHWQTMPTALADLNVTVGVTPAARDFAGRHPLHPTDASHDFGDFYSQAYLGCLPLNLIVDENARVMPKSAVLHPSNEASAPAPLREVAWAAEFLYLVEPRATALILRNAIEDTLERTGVEHPLWPEKGVRDEDIALLLLMAGRHLDLTGDRVFFDAHANDWTRCADRILQLRRRDEAMPIVQNTWDAQGVILGKEPYFVALCFAALSRLAGIEEMRGSGANAWRWHEAAEAMRAAAHSSYLDGGLWNEEHGIFINYTDYRDPDLALPYAQNWQRSPLQKQGLPRIEICLYEIVTALWLGIVHEDDRVLSAFDVLDDRYTYASGRAGIAFPPGVVRNFIALLDVCTRQRHGAPGASRLLQLICDHAFDGGLPFTAAPYGAYEGSGPAHRPGDEPGSHHTRSGQFWDNSPYFGLVLQIHYGLDYSHRGWQINTPNPLVNYPLTRVTNVRHHAATYAITWNGRGKIRRVNLDGLPHHGNVLDATEGEHEVVVYLS